MWLTSSLQNRKKIIIYLLHKLETNLITEQNKCILTDVKITYFLSGLKRGTLEGFIARTC